MERFQITGAPTCRVVYPAGLFEKKYVKGAEGDPKYNAIILIPKDDEAKINQLNAAFAEAFADLQKKGFKGKSAKALNPKNNCLVDGDELADDQEGKEAFRGYLLLKVASKNFRPIVADMQKRAILNGVALPGVAVENISNETLEDGDYVFANVSFWTYNNAAAQGVGANVHAVMRAKAGERIGGSSTDVDDYIDTGGYEPGSDYDDLPM